MSLLLWLQSKPNRLVNESDSSGCGHFRIEIVIVYRFVAFTRLISVITVGTANFPAVNGAIVPAPSAAFELLPPLPPAPTYELLQLQEAPTHRPRPQSSLQHAAAPKRRAEDSADDLSTATTERQWKND